MSFKPIKKILVIRLQATGDVLITLPYLQNLRSKLPAHVQLDFLTREETVSVPDQLTIFNNVFSLRGHRNTKLQFLSFLVLWPKLFFKRYDLLIDLQNHKLSKWIRLLLCVRSYSLFDKYSPKYAGERNKNTINALKLWQVEFSYLKDFKNYNKKELYQKFNLKEEDQFVVINPAGAFETRNWSLDNYITFCELWQERVNQKAKFLILGVEGIRHKAEYLKTRLKSSLVNLVGQTEYYEAFYLMREAKLTLSEDSSLLHASYISGTPTIGILGSTRADWTNPKLSNTYFFTSEDLPCGNCMLVQCKYAEPKCLTRVTPLMVFEKSLSLIETLSNVDETIG